MSASLSAPSSGSVGSATRVPSERRTNGRKLPLKPSSATRALPAASPFSFTSPMPALFSPNVPLQNVAPSCHRKATEGSMGPSTSSMASEPPTMPALLTSLAREPPGPCSVGVSE